MRLLPGRPTADGLVWWAEEGPALTAPEVVPSSQTLRVRSHDLASLRGATSGGPYLVAASGLEADSPYTVRVGAASGSSRTLPSRLKPPTQTQPGGGLTLSLGSCFFGGKNPGAGAFYEPSVFGGDAVQLRFLVGDQLYMDLDDRVTFWSVASRIIVPRAPDPWERHRTHWRRNEDFLGASPTVMVPDDHDFWNDFPHKKAWIGWADSDARSPIRQSLDTAFAAHQLALNLDPGFAATASTDQVVAALRDPAPRSFSFRVEPLEFFVLDVRSRRSLHDHAPHRFTPAPEFDQLINWLTALQGPGVLVLAQPLVVPKATWFEKAAHAKGDWNLPDYPAQYAALCDALFAAPHDVLVLTGDIHWSRLYRLSLPGSPRAVFEFVSSPLCLIAGDRSKDSETTLKPAGNLEWQAPGAAKRTAAWVRVQTPPPEYATYATARLRSLGASGVEVLVDFWGLNGTAPRRARHQCPTARIVLK